MESIKSTMQDFVDSSTGSLRRSTRTLISGETTPVFTRKSKGSRETTPVSWRKSSRKTLKAGRSRSVEAVGSDTTRKSKSRMGTEPPGIFGRILLML